jgi:uncharacterized caspase-like protein/WD40 repeat protein
MRLAVAIAVCFLLGIAASTASERKEGPAQFFLDLDTGGHRDFIKDLAFTPDGELLVSASDDKTIRVWDWRAGVTIRTIRGQIGPRNEGKVFAIAIAPDGETLAAGGFFGPGFGESPPYGDVRLFNLKSGKMIAVLKGHELPVYDLAFSPDGQFLAVGGQDGYVFLWRRDAAEATGWAPGEQLDADSTNIARVAFAANGTRLIATTADNGIRLWDAATHELIAMPGEDEWRDNGVRALAVSPDGNRFAIGDAAGRVEIREANDGAVVDALPEQGFSIGALAFVSGGSAIAVSCGFPCTGNEGTPVYEIGADQPAVTWRGHDGTVFASAASPDGTMVATGGGFRHEIHVWDAATAERKVAMAGSGQPVQSVRVKPDGLAIAWGAENPCPDRAACPEIFGKLDHEIPLPSPDTEFENPRAASEAAAGWNHAVHERGGWTLTAAKGGDYDLDNAVLEVAQDGREVRSIENDAANGYLHGAFTFLGNGGEFVTGGSDGTMLAYERDADRLAGEFRDGHTGQITAMAQSSDGRLLVTGALDQTIRLWNPKTRQLVASLFVSDGEWIMWTPQGYFNSSPKGDANVGWHINQGPDKEARYITARQLREHLHSPEIVRRAIITGDAAAAAKELRGTDRQLQELLEKRAPEFTIRVAEGVKAADGYIAIEIVGAAEAGASVENFSVLSNDRRISEFASRSVSHPGAEARTIIEVPVNDGENEISITGANEFGYLTERSVKALARKTSGEQKKGKLFVVAVGVERYPNLPKECNGRSCDLSFPVDDAVEFVKVLADRTSPLFEDMEVLALVNEEALEDHPEDAAALEAIAGKDNIMEPDSDNVSDSIMDFLDKPGPDDTTVIFVAGHGINIDEDYYFIPTNGRMQDESRWRRSSLVEWSDIQKSLERAKGRRFMLLDTCHAANAFNPRLEKDAADARIIVLSATAANNTAAELPELGHGVFTYAVIEGLKGAANSSGDGVRILGLADYIYREVVRLTAKRQEPFYHIAQTENFLLARP